MKRVLLFLARIAAVTAGLLVTRLPGPLCEGQAPNKNPAPAFKYSRYPWKTNILATVFWIGEEASANNPTPRTKSSWDVNWLQSYGGFDTPDATKRTVNYTPASFIPKQNPFYLALPYNDVIDSSTTKAEAGTRIPWFGQRYTGAGKSVVEGQWVAIRYGNRVCYAQWEDCGPFVTDDVEYVFGNARPKNTQNHGAGIDVSPAVRDYLGLGTNTEIDWRFVDFNEIPDGPWRTFGNNNPFVRARSDAVTTENDVLASRLEELRKMRDEYFRQTGNGEYQDLAQKKDEASAANSEAVADEAQREEAQAQFNRGVAYTLGVGVAKDEVEALKWFCKAAAKGNASAQDQLGFAYEMGNGVTKDEAEAVKWWRKASEQGNAEAQYNLGFVYSKGAGVAKDEVEAVKWFRKSADQGYASAQCNLGCAYGDGTGVPKDAVEAVKWWRKAAEQGNAEPQCNLGNAYHIGRGVPKDDRGAVKWWRKAAEQGNALAQFNLGIAYATGSGVPKDAVEAYKWCNLSAATGIDNAKRERALLEARMTPDQIAEAQKLSRAFKPVQEHR